MDLAVTSLREDGAVPPDETIRLLEGLSLQVSLWTTYSWCGRWWGWSAKVARMTTRVTPPPISVVGHPSMICRLRSPTPQPQAIRRSDPNVSTPDSLSALYLLSSLSERADV